MFFHFNCLSTYVELCDALFRVGLVAAAVANGEFESVVIKTEKKNSQKLIETKKKKEKLADVNSSAAWC